MPVARSLRGRVLVWASVALTALFVLTVIGLDIAFRQTLERSRAELLEAQLLGLIAVAETDANGRLSLPQETINPQFDLANSGLFGVVWDAGGRVVWQSRSLVGTGFPPVQLPEPGNMRYETLEGDGLPALELLVMGIAWGQEDGTYTAYTFGTAVALQRYVEEQNDFRRNVISWFIGVTVTMIVVILGVLGWVLRPVRRLAREVSDIEAGRLVRLSDEQPTELVGLAANLNGLIETERSRLSRYRNTLDDLAHSLKTPLAAMRTLLEETGTDFRGRQELGRELNRVEQRVTYQLQRARASGATGLGVEPVALDTLVSDLCATLDKVYLSKQVSCELEISPGTRFIGDAGDLSEMLGNLIENAYKYCRHRVQVTAYNRFGRLEVSVDDDGPGIPAEAFETLMQRGTRADESVDGQGIGLAVVSDTAALYDGTLDVTQSRLGGARVRLRLGRAGARARAGDDTH